MTGILAVDYKQARDYLTSRRMPTFHDARSVLERLGEVAQAAEVLKELKPDKEWKGSLGRLFSFNVERGEILEVEEDAISAVGELFPIRQDVMEDAILNLEEGQPLFIDIEPQGVSWSFDGFYEYANEPEGFDDRASVIVMAWSLDTQLEKEVWELLAERFGWPERIPRCIEMSTDGFDVDKLEKLLDEKGLSEFKDVFTIVWQNTGSHFFDISMDECDPIDFSIESVRALQEEWENAQLYLTSLNKAIERAAQDPGVLEVVIDTWDACCQFNEHPKGRTLMEIFTNERRRDANILVDPFYGPIGVDADDEDEDDEWEDEL